MRFSPKQPRNRADDRGQATVEFALLLPVFALAIWVLVALSVAVATYTEVVAASRNAARAAVISDPDLEVARNAAIATTRSRNIDVTVDTRGSYLTASVKATYLIPLPLPDSLRPRITMTSSTTMLMEPWLFAGEPDTNT